MSTSFTKLSLALLCSTTLLHGCSTTPVPGDGERAVSRYADQRTGSAAADSDAVHIPPVPHDAAAEPMAAAAMNDYFNALQALRDGDAARAESLFRDIAERYPLLSGPWVNLGLIALQQDRFDDAENALRRALEVNARNPYAHNALGLALREQGRFDEAAAHYQQAVTLDPMYARAHFNLGVLAELYLQQPADALAHFRRYQALQKQPDQTVANWITDLERRVPQGAVAAEDNKS